MTTDAHDAAPTSDRLITRAELCVRLGVAPRTLDAWRRRGVGPTPIKLTARVVRYRIADIEAWVAAHRWAA